MRMNLISQLVNFMQRISRLSFAHLDNKLNIVMDVIVRSGHIVIVW